MCGKYSPTKFANFLIIVLRVEIATIFKAIFKDFTTFERFFGNLIFFV